MTASVDAGRSSSPVFALSDVTDAVDGDLLRAVFLLSDFVVLVYRLTATYVTVRALRRRFAACSSSSRRRCPPSGLVVDGGSVLRSSSSRTALTSTSSHGVVPDATNIYVDPQSLVVENCASLLHRSGAAVAARRPSDVRHSSGRCAAVYTTVCTSYQPESDVPC